MRDMHIQAIEGKIQRIHTEKRIGLMLLVTVLTVSLIAIFSTLDTVMGGAV